MRLTLRITLLCLITAGPASAQQLFLPKTVVGDSAALAHEMPRLARDLIARYRSDDRDAWLNTTFRLQMVAGDDSAALVTLAALRQLRTPRDPVYAPVEYTQYQLYALGRIAEARSGESFGTAWRRAFTEVVGPLGDLVASRVAGSLAFNLVRSRADLDRMLEPQAGRDSIPLDDAVALCRQYFVHRVYGSILPLVPAALTRDNAARYLVDSTVDIPTRDGATVSALVARPRRLADSAPAIFYFTIYAGDHDLQIALEAAAHGYAGVVANTRGKRRSNAPILPFEHDGNDAYDVIDWISKQAWSDGKVGMYGGSYDGFTQWAAAKRLHPALKTIVPSAAGAPGLDMPGENGIVQNFQYRWLPYVTNNRLLDDSAYNDSNRWGALDSTWFARGSAYRNLDELDGTPNPVFRRWLDHPGYDAYWQAMTPQGREFAQITIPVLTTTGYFDGAQLGALHYVRELARNNPKADQYLLIGPWDHFGSQRRPAPVVAGYRVDPAALMDISDVIYQWFDHVLKGSAMPSILADRVNYEVMGANTWRHAPSLEAISNDTLTFYLSNRRSGARYALTPKPVVGAAPIVQVVDMKDRTVATNNFIHDPLVDTTLDVANGIAFVSAPLARATTINGAFAGDLRLTINKRDVDVGVQLYELNSAGEYFQLSYFVGRASYTGDPTTRHLLRPGLRERIAFRQTRLVSREVPAGSRIVVVLNVNRGPHAQINYGSGKEVSDETIADAGAPIRIQWHGASLVRIPIWRQPR